MSVNSGEISDFAVHDVQQLGRSVATTHRPTTVDDALAVLAERPEARPIAGGTDLLLDLQRSGPGDAVTLVDVTGIEGFRDISDGGDHWRLAGGVTHNQVVMHDGIVASALPIAQACLEVGSPQLRNRATIAGNLATASPANDTISALMVLGANLEISRRSGGQTAVRSVAVADFFTGFRKTDLRHDELITAIDVPKLTSSQRGIWVKLGLRRAQAISVVHAGIVLDLDGSSVRAARLSIGSVAPTVVLVDDFASALVGSVLDESSIQAAAEATVDSIAPITDGRATAQYRRDGVRTLIVRSLEALATDRQASMWPDAPTLSTPRQLAATSPVNSPIVSAETEIVVEVNGRSVSAPAGSLTLLDWIRENAGLTGMKEGCAEGECGACTMLVDGAAVMSCLISAPQADGRTVTTVEGLEHPIQNAFVDDFAVQCGFCIPGFLMSGARLIEEVPDPTDDQIRLALSGNLCRCTGYYPIMSAVRDAAVEVRGSHG